MKQNILYLNKSANIGGSETSLFLLLKHLDRETYNPIVVLPSSGPLVERLHQIGVKVIITPLRTIHLRGGNPFPYLGTVFRLVKVIRRERIRLVHSNNHTTNQYGAVAARLCGVPLVCHMRDMNSTTSINRAFLPWANKLIANSTAVAESYLKCRATPDKITVIYNGVDLADYTCQRNSGFDFRRQLGVPDDTFLLGIVGRIVPPKGHQVLVRALAEVNRRGRDFCLAIMGPTEVPAEEVHQLDKQFLEELKQLIERLGLGTRIVFSGFQRNVADVYSALDLLVLPSFEEPFGRTLIEAMATEVPVVATAAGGPLEIVEDGVTGLLVPRGDMYRLAEAILGIIENRELSRRMGKEGRKRVETLFTIERNVRETEQVYRELLQLAR